MSTLKPVPRREAAPGVPRFGYATSIADARLLAAPRRPEVGASSRAIAFGMWAVATAVLVVLAAAYIGNADSFSLTSLVTTVTSTLSSGWEQAQAAYRDLTSLADGSTITAPFQSLS